MTVDFLARLFDSTPKDRVVRPKALKRAIEREQGLIDEYARRVPWIPLVQQRTGQDDSALGTASFAGLEARPRRLILTTHPAVTYVELAFRYAWSSGEVFAANLGRARLYARIEDPLWLAGASHTVEQIRASDKLREAYFSRVFAVMAAQSDCNLDLGAWLGRIFLPEACAGERDWLGSVQNFNHDIAAARGRPGAGLDAFRAAVHGFDFRSDAPRLGPVSLRMSVRPHQREDGAYSQSITHVFLGSSRGIAFVRPNGKVDFTAAGHAFESRFEAFVRQTAADRLAQLSRRSWRRSAEERVWGGPGECEAYFHNHDRFFMRGREWRLERDAEGNPGVMGTHRNVAAFSSEGRRVAVKAVPFESVGDLVRLIQAHQYVHGVQGPALLAQARAVPELAEEVLTTATSLLSQHDEQRVVEAPGVSELLGEDFSTLFKRNIGPLLHQVRVDYEHKLMLTVLAWSDEGMLSDASARKRLIEECSLSHRLRMAANLFRNGLQMLADDVTHTDLKPENILNQPGAAFRAQQKARKLGWKRLGAHELESLAAGEKIFEGDFSGIHFGREGGVDNLAHGEGLPTSIAYSSWQFTALGLSEDSRPTALRQTEQPMPRLDALLLQQDIANRGTTAWEIIYGSLVDCIPPADREQRVRERRTAQQRVGRHLEQAICLRREGREDAEVMRELDTAIAQCDRRLLDIVSLRPETIDSKSRLTPLFQAACDNCNGLAVWLDPRVIEMLDHLACDLRHEHITRRRVAKLYRTAEALLRAEASRLERADARTASTRRHRMAAYMTARRLHFNPDSGLLGVAELPHQLAKFAELVENIPDPRRALSEFARTWPDARAWGASVLDTMDDLRLALADSATGNGERGREELRGLVRSALLREHENRIREESRAGEQRIRPPYLGLFERRRPRAYFEDGEIRLSYRIES